MPAEVKNSISHRGKALQALKTYFVSNPPTKISYETDAKKLKEDESENWRVLLEWLFMWNQRCVCGAYSASTKREQGRAIAILRKASAWIAVRLLHVNLWCQESWLKILTAAMVCSDISFNWIIIFDQRANSSNLKTWRRLLYECFSIWPWNV